MFTVHNLLDSANIYIVDEKGPFTVIEYAADLSTDPQDAMRNYYASRMNIRKRQLVCKLEKGGVTVQKDSMQWMVGDVHASSGIRGVGDLFGKAIRGKVTGESAVKPVYEGSGLLVLEPCWKHILLMDLSEWNGSMVVEDGMFLACTSGVRQSISARTSISSAALGNEGLFNLCLQGQGIVALESAVPASELVEVDLDNDVLKIDGSFALAWSSSLSFTVERSSKSLAGSYVSGEGFVNTFRGTGKVLLAPVLSENKMTIGQNKA